MKLPTPPPRADYLELLREPPQGVDPETIFQAKPIDDKGRYLSWDEFRRRHASDALTAEQAWALQRLARRSRAVVLPFTQRNGRPFTVTEVGPLRHKLHQIDSGARGHLTSFATIAPDAEANRHFVRSLLEEPFSSSVFEGAVTTRERAKEMIEEGRDPVSRDDRMVLNNYRAMQFVREHTDEALTPQLVFDIHALITDGTLDKPDAAGRLRWESEDIAIWDESTGEVVHKPPPADQLAGRLDALCSFANEDYELADPFLNPVTRAILLHFMIGYDHPFVDGNGRTARALFYWYVLKHGYWLLEYASISLIIREQTGLTYERAYLNAETDDGDASYFVLHQLDVILRAMDALKDYLETKAREIDTVAAAVERLNRSGQVNHRQAALLAEAAKHPERRFTIGQHQKVNGIVYLTARKDLEQLLALNLLDRTKAGRSWEYRASDELIERLANV